MLEPALNASIEKLNGPPSVGVPLRTPVLELRDEQARGGAESENDQVNGGGGPFETVKASANRHRMWSHSVTR